MNPSITTRFTSFAIACVMTLAMLMGIDGLATSDPPHALLARAAASSPV